MTNDAHTSTLSEEEQSIRDRVLFVRKGPVAEIVLNRPEKLNALTYDMYDQIGAHLAAAEADPEIRVVVLRGRGRAFSAGFDLALEMAEEDLVEHQRLVEAANANRWRLWGMGKPTIALVQGYCIAGALDLVLPTDFTIVAEDAQLAEPGILYGDGPVFMIVPWLVGPKRAKDIVLGGERFSGAEAAEWGVATKAVPADTLDEEGAQLAQRLAKMPPDAFRRLKAAVNRSYEIRGMRTDIDSWTDVSIAGFAVRSGAADEFAQRVARDGVKAASRWRDGHYAATDELTP